MENEALIINEIINKLKEAEAFNQNAVKSIPPYKVILFFLDKYIKKNYFGDIVVKVRGCKISSPEEQNVTHRLDLMYNYEGSNE